MPPPRIAAIVPCYNTSRACIPVIAGALRHCQAVVAVDDGSTDDTAAAMASTGCRIIVLQPNRGKGAALEAGLRAIVAEPGMQADYVLVIDGDGQHDPADIPAFAAAAADGAPDLVLGVRDPRAMPRKNRIGNHFGRLLFLIGTGRYVADTQCGFRLMSKRLVASILDRVQWTGYEAASDVLWRALPGPGPVAAVPIATIYIDGNRGSRFDAWRDSARIAGVFAPQIAWTVAMAWLDIAIFAALVFLAGTGPVAANVLSRSLAVAMHLVIRRSALPRLRGLAREQGKTRMLLAFAGHLALTTAQLGGFVASGAPPLAGKLGAQLAGYLLSFAAADRVMFRRAVSSPLRAAGHAGIVGQGVQG
jgi:hypothetical protein